MKKTLREEELCILLVDMVRYDWVSYDMVLANLFS